MPAHSERVMEQRRIAQRRYRERHGTAVRHIARGNRTLCHREVTSGVSAQLESEPLGEVTCDKCLASAAAVNVVPIATELDLTPVLSENDERVLRNVRKAVLFTPISVSDWTSINRLERVGLVRQDGVNPAHKTRRGQPRGGPKVASPTFVLTEAGAAR